MRISEDSSNLIEFLCDLLLHCDEDVYLSRRKKKSTVFKYTLRFCFNIVLVSTSHIDYLSAKINHFPLIYPFLKDNTFVYWGAAKIFNPREVTYCK